jgi:hypothetical protein
LPVAAAAAASERASAADRAIAAHLAAVGNATLTLSSASPSVSQSGDQEAIANEASASSSASTSSSSEPTPAALWAEMQRLIAALADSHRRHSVAAADDTRHAAAQVWRYRKRYIEGR